MYGDAMLCYAMLCYAWWRLERYAEWNLTTETEKRTLAPILDRKR
jgi:hypothetical protein